MIVKPHLCREPSCSVIIAPGPRYRDFCSTECRRLYQHRNLARGARLYDVAMKWRHQKRSHAKGAKNPRNRWFGDMTNLLDEWRREDVETRAAALSRTAEPRQTTASRPAQPSPAV